MPTIALGRDQYIEVDDQRLNGTRQFDVDVQMQEVDVTSWQHAWKTSLPVCAEVTVSMTVYGQEDAGVVIGKFNQHPPAKVKIALSSIGTGYFVPTQLRAAVPVDGIVAYDVTFKGFQYEI